MIVSMRIKTYSMRISGGSMAKKAASKNHVSEEGVIGYLNADWGNRLLKQMQAGKPKTVTRMENLVLDLSQTAWNQQLSRYQNRPADFDDTMLFAVKERKADEHKPSKEAAWLPCMVGDASKHHGKPKAQTGEVKYRYDYLGKVACANFLRQWPNGHEHIVLHLAHPSQSIGQVDDMLDTVLGQHKVKKIDGKEVTFIVREAIPWDEPSGGIVSFLTGEKGQYNPHELRPRDMILVVDIGGGVTSLTRVLVQRDAQGKMKLQPIYDPVQSPSFDVGIRHVMDKFASELKDTHTKFKSMKKDAISDDMLEEGLRVDEDGEHYITLWGDKVNVTEQVQKSDYFLLDTLQSLYDDRMGGGAPFRLVVLTGGGNKSLYQQVSNTLKHPYMETAAELDKLYLANLYGGDEIFRQWVAAQG
jgi:hypothetical protein